jgi:hypothetical protein
LAATGFTAALLTGALLTGALATGVLLTGALAAVFEAVLAATFEAATFEPVALAAVFAVLLGIELLLFFEDFAAEAFLAVLASLREARARLLVALRLAAAAFLETLEALFLRVFCDTACARKLPRPCSMFSREPGAKATHGWIRLVMCPI